MEAARPWWGEYAIEDGQSATWLLGARWIQIQRIEDELTVFSDLDESRSPDVDYTPDAPPCEQSAVARLLGVTPPITFKPALLDRTVVARPVSPATVAPGQTVAFYLSSPVTVEISVGDRLLHQLGTAKVRGTWIGASPRIGELGYAMRSHARTARSRITDHPTRAISRVELRNVGTEALKLERVHLPMRQLALYGSATHELWTSSMTLRVDGQTVVEAKVNPQAPGDAVNAHQIRPALDPVDRGTLKRMFDVLLNVARGS